MSFRELERDFKATCTPENVTNEAVFRSWMLRLLFEIAGNLDSLVVSYRELVKLNKERAAK